MAFPPVDAEVAGITCHVDNDAWRMMRNDGCYCGNGSPRSYHDSHWGTCYLDSKNISPPRRVFLAAKREQFS